MWLVKNTLKATLTLRGLDVSIPAGGVFDLDTLGRDSAERSAQVQVAFEEGYLSNVYKAARAGDGLEPAARQAAAAAIPGLSEAVFAERMESFRAHFLRELKDELGRLQTGAPAGQVSPGIAEDVRELVGEIKQLRERFETVRGSVQRDPSLSDGEIRARLAFLEEQERELLKNFETVGRRVEQDDGDVMDKADMLANL